MIFMMVKFFNMFLLEIKMATLLTLSHMLHEEDYHLLTVDEDFMTYFLNLIKKAIANGSHFVQICSNVGHLTEIREMFDAFSKVYRLKENQDVIDRMKKDELAYQILLVLKKADLDEKLFALQMMKSMCTFKMGKTIFQVQVTQKSSHILWNNITRHKICNLHYSQNRKNNYMFRY